MHVPMLVFRTASHCCAIPGVQVAEVMRPLPLQPLPGAPHCVLGVAVIRARPVPVLSLARLLTGGTDETITRFITVRIGASSVSGRDAGPRLVALAVARVVGLRDFPQDRLSELPPLLAEAGHAAVSALELLDGGLMLQLQLGRVLPEAEWERMLAQVVA